MQLLFDLCRFDIQYICFQISVIWVEKLVFFVLYKMCSDKITQLNELKDGDIIRKIITESRSLIITYYIDKLASRSKGVV